MVERLLRWRRQMLTVSLGVVVVALCGRMIAEEGTLTWSTGMGLLFGALYIAFPSVVPWALRNLGIEWAGANGMEPDLRRGQVRAFTDSLLAGER